MSDKHSRIEQASRSIMDSVYDRVIQLYEEGEIQEVEVVDVLLTVAVNIAGATAVTVGLDISKVCDILTNKYGSKTVEDLEKPITEWASVDGGDSKDPIDPSKLN